MKKVVAVLFIVTLWAGVANAVSIGVNFCDAWPTPHLAGETADGFSNWTDSKPVDDWSDAANGTGLVVLGSSDLVTCDWASSNTWAAGSEDTSEQQLYRVYLDDGGNGALITISGLDAWMAAVGAPGYTVRIYQSTDWTSSFLATDITDGTDVLESVLATNMWTTDGGTRAYADSGILTAGTIYLDGAPNDGTDRGCIAGFRITAVPEPATLVLMGLGGLSLLRRRK